MRAVIQRVLKAGVSRKSRPQDRREINRGLVVFLGIGEADTGDDVNFLSGKTTGLRIFTENGKFNSSAIDINADILIIPQFTLFGDCRKGRRPDFKTAAPPEKARELYKLFVERIKLLNLKVEEGWFGVEMNVEIHNDGPVTITMDTEQLLKKSIQ